MFYVAVILIADVIIILGDLFAGGSFDISAVLRSSAVVFGGTVAIIAIDGLEAFLIRRLPNKWFSPDKGFNVGKREKKIYSKLRIYKLSRIVPELGMFTGFHKDKLPDRHDTAFISRFILESNYGILIHLINAVSGILLPLIPCLRHVHIFVPIMAVNAVLNILPFCLLRYNLFSLNRLYRKT